MKPSRTFFSIEQFAQNLLFALMVALVFDLFFIPPFYTFTVGSLEGWLVLAIFLAVAILVVGRIQSSLSKAKTSEHESILMYELSAALAGLRTQEAVAHTVARFFQERYLIGQAIERTQLTEASAFQIPAPVDTKAN